MRMLRVRVGREDCVLSDDGQSLVTHTTGTRQHVPLDEVQQVGHSDVDVLQRNRVLLAGVTTHKHRLLGSEVLGSNLDANGDTLHAT